MVEVRYFAGAADAAGTSAETLDATPDLTVGELKALLSARPGPRLAPVLDVAVFLVGDEMIRDDARTVGPRVDVLPPFAGG